MHIGVVGTGYVGLVVGACLAENGNFVACVDNDEAKVERLRRGEIPIYEPGLNEMVPRNVAEERLRFTTDLEEAVRTSDVMTEEFEFQFFPGGSVPAVPGSTNSSPVEKTATRSFLQSNSARPSVAARPR